MNTYTIPRHLLLNTAMDLLIPMGGNTVNINHEDCPAGNDTRRRLYVTITPEGTLLGYCHNCGSKGWTRLPKTGTVTNIHAPRDIECNAPHKAESAQPMLRSFQFLDNYMNLTRVVFKSDESIYERAFPSYPHVGFESMARDYWYTAVHPLRGPCFIFPCFSNDDVGNVRYEGGQVRFTDKDPDTGKTKNPKCLSFGVVSPHIINWKDHPTVIVVEDRISAVIIAELGFATCCMHGAKVMSSVTAHSLSMMFDQIVLWYDNDNDAVEKAAQESLEILRLFMPTAHRLRIAPDPKKCSTGYILDFLSAWGARPT